jgi:hypothetical protein
MLLIYQDIFMATNFYLDVNQFFCLWLYLIRWRTMFGIAVIPSILLAVGMAFSPESPRWLFQVSVCNQKKTVHSGCQYNSSEINIFFLALTAARKSCSSWISCKKTLRKRKGYWSYVWSESKWPKFFWARSWLVCSSQQALLERYLCIVS